MILIDKLQFLYFEKIETINLYVKYTYICKYVKFYDKFSNGGSIERSLEVKAYSSKFS